MLQYDGILALDRFERAVQKVRERLLRVTGLLEQAGIPYAVVGGNAVMAWVETVDESVARPTADVDLALRRVDLERTKALLEKHGFRYRHSAGIDMFLDGPDAKARDGVHVLMAGEKVRDVDAAAVPDVSEAVSFGPYKVMGLESLVRMKLVSNRRKDQTHLLDMIGIGMIDATWPEKYGPPLDERLQQLLDDPDG